MTLSEYSQLKQQVILKAGESKKHSQILSALKEYYRDEIDSPRRYEQINTISQLLKILEIRDVLSEDNVTPLKEVVCRLPSNSELLEKLGQYETKHIPREYTNHYTLNRIESTPKTEPVQSFNNHPLGIISPRKRDRIMETVIEEIGIFWCDLARYLNVRECVIDEIDVNNKTLSDKASNLLEFYETRADPQRWFYNLCEGLEKARRKDISRSLQDIMSMNI